MILQTIPNARTDNSYQKPDKNRIKIRTTDQNLIALLLSTPMLGLKRGGQMGVTQCSKSEVDLALGLKGGADGEKNV